MYKTFIINLFGYIKFTINRLYVIQFPYNYIFKNFS
jgi:hypothetical protein